MTRATVVAVLIGASIISSIARPAAAQNPSDLVVSIPGDKEFHQPGCPLVAKAGSSVRVMKRSEAIRRKLTPHAACGAATGSDIAVDPNATKVFTQPRDNKYHTATCPKLGAERTSITLDEAGRKWWPCPVCKPPVRQRTIR
jgi:hypothetical protein